ncbi:MAG: hypothetical protein IPN71_18980 [Fibrobacteres bacterium]|nr:hypothetical protein [Fibrobacterota bacterium]
MKEAEPTSAAFPAATWLIGRKIDAFFQTKWTNTTPYLVGLGAPRYCEILLQLDGSLHQLLADRLIPWAGKLDILPIDLKDHGVSASLFSRVCSAPIRSVVRDEDGDLLLELDSNVRIHVEVDYGVHLIVEGAA